MQSAAIALGLFAECDSLLIPYASAEIPPAGVPSGFDFTAFIGFRAHLCMVMPLRSEGHCRRFIFGQHRQIYIAIPPWYILPIVQLS